MSVTQARRARLRLGFHPLSPSRWPDLVALFGVNGACGGCWCMWPRRSSAEFRRGKGAGNRRVLRQLVGLRRPIGLLAYVDDRAVGWCAVAPRSDFQRLERSRVLQPVDEQPVWSVVCLFVARQERRQGVTVELLEQAFRYATRKGARIVEGYPLDVSGRTADTFAWWGTASAFRKAGFEEVARRSPTRPIMRRWLRRTAPRATPPPDRRGRG